MLSADQLLPGQAAWVALPSVHHGKNHSYWATILQLSWSGRQSRSTLQLSASFVCPPSPPIQVYCTQPPLRHTEHMTSKREYSKGRSQIFLAVILFGSCPPRHQLIQPQWLPLSFSLTYRARTCLPLLASKGNRGGANHMTAKQMWFSSLLLFHAYMQSHSFSISNLVLAVPSTEILKWITDFHTSKHFT